MVKLGSKSLKVRFLQQWESLGLPLILVIFVVLFSLLSPAFRTSFNFLSILRFSSFIAISAVGMAFCMMAGEFDISIGSMMALSGVLGASLVPVIGGVAAVFTTIAISSFLGLINGLFVTKLRIPAFITTLGMMFVFRSIAFMYTDNVSVPIKDSFWLFIGNGRVLGINFPIILMVICFIVGFVLLRKSPFGRYVVSVGSNKSAAALSGINVDLIKISVFVMVGFFVGIASLVISANLGVANPGLLGQGYEFQVITAVVLGGTVLGGGNGSLGGAFIAVIILASLRSGMGIMQVSSYWQYVFTGTVLIFAVAINRLKHTLSGHET